MPDITAAVSTLIEVANRHDTLGFLACFTEDGAVDDGGRELRGAQAIRGWSDREFVGVNVNLDVTDVTAVGRSVTVAAKVGGDGFQRPLAFQVQHCWRPDHPHGDPRLTARPRRPPIYPAPTHTDHRGSWDRIRT